MSIRWTWAEDERTPAPPLSAAEVAEAEAELKISFPDEYREFLLHVSAGNGRVRRLARGPDGWRWDSDTETDLEMLPTPFPDQDSVERWWAEHDAREPDRDDPSWDAWDREGEELGRRWGAGAVCLQDYGCGFCVLLVVTGPSRGTVWFDRRSACDDIVPLRSEDGRPVGFAEWLASPWRHWFDRAVRRHTAPG
ncbi:hypothetical protein F4560_003095 [Saccharothrix ecbatanensis]|uniref:Knr4/Smi1-like domain-containing protein n=1 Tax=Saccharothrix ecbatanensis TaxID=1105145 RepID=A0A7W9HJA7_9PSEU|nr:SMI1/KNR4 family protein [Saccharothrix ecbatanensis]MBB5803327.1 hypothetical protein [Saccharothrix ecbatanensis]